MPCREEANFLMRGNISGAGVFLYKRRFVEKERWRHLQLCRDLLQAAGADSIRARVVLVAIPDKRCPVRRQASVSSGQATVAACAYAGRRAYRPALDCQAAGLHATLARSPS